MQNYYCLAGNKNFIDIFLSFFKNSIFEFREFWDHDNSNFRNMTKNEIPEVQSCELLPKRIIKNPSTTQDPKRFFFLFWKKSPARTPIGTIHLESHELNSREKEHDWNWSISIFIWMHIKIYKALVHFEQ